MKKLLIAFLILLSASSATAHKGGHGNEGDSHDRTWHLEDRTVEGSFLLVKNNEVFIEQGDEVISLHIEKLSMADQEYINKKLQHDLSLNKQIAGNANNKKPGSLFIFLMSGIAICMAFLVIVTLRSLRRRFGGLQLE